MHKNSFNRISVATIFAIIAVVASVMVGCQKEEDDNNNIINSVEMEEFIIAAFHYQHALNLFNREIKKIDFFTLNTSQDPEGNTIVNIPTSVSIEEKAKILNDKKKLLFDKWPKIVSLSSLTRSGYIQQTMQNSSKVNKKMLEWGILINQPRLKGFTFESFTCDNVSSYLDSQLASSGYVEVVIILFADGTAMTYIDDKNDANTANYPTIVKMSNGNWYFSLHSDSPISSIGHTHQYSDDPSTADQLTRFDGLPEFIYTSGSNFNYYQ